MFEKIKVKAEQWVPGKKIDGVSVYADAAFFENGGEGVTPIFPGDWVVTTAMGQQFAVSDDMFHKFYEQVAA